MKKVLYILILLMLPLFVSAQAVDILDRHKSVAYNIGESISSHVQGLMLNQGIHETDGVDYALTRIEVTNSPSITRKAVLKFVEAYGDIYEVKPWTNFEGDQFCEIALINDKLGENYSLYILVAYIPDSNLMGIYATSYFNEEEE